MRHPVDQLGGAIVAHGPERLRFFTDGWGDPSVIESVAIPNDVPDPIRIEWVSEAAEKNLSLATKLIDKNVKWNQMHRNTAARKKSRLAQAVDTLRTA